MAEKMKKELEQAEEQKEVAQETKPEEPKTENQVAEKKGFFASLGTGAKIAAGVLGAGLLTGVVILIKNLFGGDDEEPEAIEATQDTEE